MKRWIRWVGTLLILSLMAQPGFASAVARDEISGRGEEKPVGILAVEEGIYVAFQEPGRIVVYDHEWVEQRILDLPDDYTPDEMIMADHAIWVLDEKQGVILQIDPSELYVIQSFGGESPYVFEAIFEADGLALVMDERGYVYQINEEFALIGWMTGLKLYQSVVFDGYHVYLGGRVNPAESGVLVKTVENKLEDEWLMSDDSRVPLKVDVVERIRLLSDGYFYVVYRDTGIVKYDEYGNYRNRVYQRNGEEKVFRDIALSSKSGIYYMVDQNTGIFEVKWTKDRRISIKKDLVDMSRLRLSSRTVRGITTAQVGDGKLAGFYQTDGTEIQLLMPTRDAETLKLRISVADLIEAQAQGVEMMEIQWKEEVYSFQISEWVLELCEAENIEEQFVEVKIDQEQTVIDICVVEWLDEISKLVRRENLE